MKIYDEKGMHEVEDEEYEAARREERVRVDYLYAHRNDPGEWEPVSEGLEKGTGGIVVSTRLNPEQARRAMELAEQEGVKLTELVRRALDYYWARRKLISPGA